MQITANGIRLEVEQDGKPRSPPVLLIMGLGMQLTSWPVALVERLVMAGYRVIRFDNRDIGLSSHLDHLGKNGLIWSVVKSRLRMPVRVPYTIADMSHDALGVLDALGIKQAHVVGASMGGMIAQRLAIAHPHRVISLTSIMSSSGARGLPDPTLEIRKALVTRPQTRDKEVVLKHSVRLLRMIGSQANADPIEEIHARAARNFDRSFHPEGVQRQMMAIVADTGRAEELHRITAPTLVLHGTDDPMVPFECGADTARRIPGARLVGLSGMGHDLPRTFMDPLCTMMVEHFRAAVPKRRAPVKKSPQSNVQANSRKKSPSNSRTNVQADA